MSLPTTGASPPAAGDRPRRPLNPPLGVPRRLAREVGLGLVTAGVILLLFVGYQLFGTNLAEARSQMSLQKSFDAAVAAHHTGAAGAAGPTGATKGSTGSGDTPTVGGPSGAAPSTPTGQAIDHLVIPKIGVDKFVVQGVGEDDLRKGPGHYPGTPLPGQAGNAAIAGHRTTYGAPFFRLNELSVGDPIDITDTSGREFRYVVSEAPMVVSPSDVAVLDPTPQPQLTLTTCNPRFSATSRLVVVAKLSGQQQPLPDTPVTGTAALGGAAASFGSLGSGDHRAWPPAVGFGALVVALWVGTRLLINRTRRWARVGAYLGGIAVCLVALWFCFDNVVRLLPQSI